MGCRYDNNSYMLHLKGLLSALLLLSSWCTHPNSMGLNDSVRTGTMHWCSPGECCIHASWQQKHWCTVQSFRGFKTHRYLLTFYEFMNDVSKVCEVFYLICPSCCVEQSVCSHGSQVCCACVRLPPCVSHSFTEYSVPHGDSLYHNPVCGYLGGGSHVFTSSYFKLRIKYFWYLCTII